MLLIVLNSIKLIINQHSFTFILTYNRYDNVNSITVVFVFIFTSYSFKLIDNNY